ncbi:MAG: hypothetical protein ACLRMZ_14255 [Blautia marasmi]
MYLNGDHFTGGKSVILPITAVLFLIISISGILYGFRTAKAVKQLTISIREIASRRYLPVRGKGIFPDLYESLTHCMRRSGKATGCRRKPTKPGKNGLPTSPMI